ncbi:MAG: peptidoglycan DD-metalloendopeptidase family protein [Endomicrobiia bacterium]
MKIFYTLFLIFVYIVVLPQSKSELQKKIEETEQQIKQTTQKISETENNKKLIIQQLDLVNQKIVLRNQYLKKLNQEIDKLTIELEKTNYIITNLTKDLNDLKQEYVKMIMYAQKNRNAYNRLMFILSSETFNQAYKRIKYMQYYNTYRKVQMENIVIKQDSLKINKQKLAHNIEQKNNLVTKIQDETILLSLEKKNQIELMEDIEKNHKSLIAELKEKETLKNNLKKEIQRIIEEEEKKKKLIGKKLTDAEIKLSAEFGQNIGKLPWPVVSGTISQPFGEQRHPYFPNVMINNNGIDISVGKDDNCRAIFNGVVSKIIMLPGSNAAILIRHGEYITVYSNIVDIQVKNGQEVKTGQIIGKAFRDADTGNSTMQLQIWKGTTKLNPENWLRK